MSDLDIKDLFFRFVSERNTIYHLKEDCEPKPWTTDPILQRYKFTNVMRERDRTSVWVARNWRDPHQNEPDVWFAMAVAVMTNKIETMSELGYPVPFKLDYFLNVTREHGFGTAYMLTTHRKPIPKPIYYGNILDTLWRNKDKFAPTNYPTLGEWHTRLCHLDGVALFIAAQIIAATKYIPVLRNRPDWASFVASGPGSRRGLNRLLKLHIDNPWYEAQFADHINELRGEILDKCGLDLHAQDTQNCLCEFDKYCRIFFNESGRPKCRYDGGEP